MCALTGQLHRLRHSDVLQDVPWVGKAMKIWRHQVAALWLVIQTVKSLQFWHFCAVEEESLYHARTNSCKSCCQLFQCFTLPLRVTGCASWGCDCTVPITSEKIVRFSAAVLDFCGTYPLWPKSIDCPLFSGSKSYLPWRN